MASTSNNHFVQVLAILGGIAVAGMVVGAILAVDGYSSAGAFAIASACVGVLGTLATEHVHDRHD